MSPLNTTLPRRRRSTAVALCGIFLLAVLVRLSYASHSPFTRTRFYPAELFTLASSVARGGGIGCTASSDELQFRVQNQQKPLLRRDAPVFPIVTIPEPVVCRYYAYRLSVPYVLLAGWIFRLAGGVTAAPLMVVQLVLDSFGCLLAYLLLAGFRRSAAWAAALVYAVWPASVYYSSANVKPDSLVPVLVLAGAVLVLLTCTRSGWRRYAYAASAGVALALLAGIRTDNALPVAAICILLAVLSAIDSGTRFNSNNALNPVRWARVLVLPVILMLSLTVTLLSFHLLLRKNMKADHAALGNTLWNILAEYPGLYPGFRVWNDGFALQYSIRRNVEYRKSRDRRYIIARAINYALGGWQPEQDSQFPVFIKEIILDHPVRYTGWLLSRLVVYSMGHPATAYIILEDWYGEVSKDQPAYLRLRWIDFTLFVVAVWGAWTLRKQRVAWVLWCFYIGILLAHAVAGVGDIHYRVVGPVDSLPVPLSREQHDSFWEPRYLLGMTSVFPLFIGVAISDVFEKLRRRKTRPSVRQAAAGGSDELPSAPSVGARQSG